VSVDVKESSESRSWPGRGGSPQTGPKRRGREVSKAALVFRLAETRTQARSASGGEKVLAAQEVRGLQIRVANVDAAGGSDVKTSEVAFVKIAKQLGENREVGRHTLLCTSSANPMLATATFAIDARSSSGHEASELSHSPRKVA